MKLDSKILITGATGMVGKAFVSHLENIGYTNILTVGSKVLDLRNSVETFGWFKINRPEFVFHLAAKVGGIKANMSDPSGFLNDNLLINLNVLNAAKKNGVKKLLFLGSSCIYPRLCPQPMKEEYLLDGKLEPTNEGYALSKVVGLKLCEYYYRQYNCDFISIMPPNLFGIGDDFSTDNSHVISAMIRKFHKAKLNNEKYVEVWGTGNAKREFLYIDDLVDVMVFVMNNYSSAKFINTGSGKDISISELALLIKKIVGFEGQIIFDNTKSDGMPRKLLDSSKIIDLGWEPKITLEKGINKVYKWYEKNG